MTHAAWITLGSFAAGNLILLALGWARLSARLAVFEAKLDDVIGRPARWCELQQKQCEDRYEHREVTGVHAVGAP